MKDKPSIYAGLRVAIRRTVSFQISRAYTLLPEN